MVTPIKLQRLAELVGAEYFGDPEQSCCDARPLNEVQPEQITLLDDAKSLPSLLASPAAAVVMAAAAPELPIAQLIVANPHAAFEKIVAQFRAPYVPVAGLVSPQATIAPTAQIGEGCSIHAGVHVGDHVVIESGVTLMPGVVVMPHSRIGRDCFLYPSVTLYEHTVLEERVTIHAGSVLGAFGFGYRQEAGTHQRTAQLGYVHIEADVELGAGVTIDRGTYGTTRIGTGTKIDNQVMIAHNCQIGRRNLICSQVGIAGSCSTGNDVVLAGQVGLKDHVHLGDGAVVGAQAGVMDDKPGGAIYLGSPATTQREQMQIMAVQRKLPAMRRSLQQLAREVAELAQRLDAADADRPSSRAA